MQVFFIAFADGDYDKDHGGKSNHFLIIHKGSNKNKITRKTDTVNKNNFGITEKFQALKNSKVHAKQEFNSLQLISIQLRQFARRISKNLCLKIIIKL